MRDHLCSVSLGFKIRRRCR